MSGASAAIAGLQAAVLDAVAGGAPLRTVADLLCQRVEQIAPGVVATLVRVDTENRLRPVGSPSMPKRYCDAIDGIEVGDAVGTCGSAAFRGEPVVSLDIRHDPAWPDAVLRELPPSLGSCWSSPIDGSDGSVIGTFAFYFATGVAPDAVHHEIVDACLPLCRIAIERQQNVERIALLTHYEALTGLPNRSSLQTHLAELVADPAVRRLAVLHVDIDRFADVNESLGFADGDLLLIDVAHRLQGPETMAATDALYSLGGDGYALVLVDADVKLATARAERVLAVVGRPLELSDLPVTVTASIGISLYPHDAATSAELMRQADVAVARAKATGGGTYRFAGAAVDRAAQDRLVLGTALRSALDRGGLYLTYQPQVDLASLRLHGVEALARWDDPQRGPIGPDRFIALAEQIGLIADLDVWVLGTACRQLADWDRRGVDVPSVSVNFSPQSFREGLPDIVAARLAENGLAADRLTIEVTESLVMDDVCVQTARQVGALGVGLSIDDFGTGFSAISRLPFLPITELKIDRSFLQGIDQSPASLALTRAVVGIGDSLGLAVVAEGVETVRQGELLRELGCHLGQGFLFAKPEPADAFEQWLTRNDVG